jgi:glycosyltransferase involved in cell wall biosynthesis
MDAYPNTTGAITIVMPALNEAAAVGVHVRRLLASPALGELPVRHVIVVDNGSTDDTAGAAREAGAEVVCEPRRGYGWACLAGVRAASERDVVLLMDADGSDDPAGAAEVAALVLNDAADLALGSRTRGRAERGALTPQQRAGNAIGVSLLRMLTGARLSDLGPQRAIRRERLLALDMCEMTYGWSTEMLIKALRAGYRVAEVPVDHHRRAGGVSKVSGTLRGTVGASWSILSTLARYVRWQPPVLVASEDGAEQAVALASNGGVR